MAYQRAFWRGEMMRHHGREDRIRPNPEAKPMYGGPGEQDFDDRGGDVPELGKSQPKSRGNANQDEFPLRHANVRPHRHQRQMHQVLMAHALRMHFGDGRPGPDGTTMGTAIGGGAAGGGAG